MNGTCTNADGKSRIVKAQLACTATMLALNTIYIILFVIILASSRQLYKPLSPSFQSMPSPHNSSPIVLPNAPIQSTPSYPTPYYSSYESRYRPPMYPEHPNYWRPSTPYMNQVEKF